MENIKVLLIEDNRLLREGTTAMLNEQKGICAVSSGGNRNAITKAMDFAPDIVLLDVGLKSDNSLKVLGTIRKQHPRTEVIVMDLIPAHTDVVKALKSGVSSVVPGNAAFDDVLRAIRSIGSRPKTPPPTVADSLFTKIVERTEESKTKDRMTDSVSFTKPELEVIVLLAEGKSVSAIARAHGSSILIVNNYLRNIMKKMSLHLRRVLVSLDGTKSASKVVSARPKRLRFQPHFN